MGALDDNLATAARMREQRIADSMGADPGSLLVGGRLIGGPIPDPAWDAFFGALQQKRADATANGQRFGLSVRGLGLDTSPAIQGLHMAATPPQGY